jgi:hypothetical protein
MADGEDLRAIVNRLRSEIDRARFADNDSRKRLAQLVTDVERKLESPDEEPDDSLPGRLKEAIGRFEAEHPRAADLLNQIALSLGSVGI